MFKKYIFSFLIVGLLSNLGYTQQTMPKYVTIVFDNLINAYGSIKIPPVLEFSKSNETVVALYVSFPRPTVKIDKKFLVVCSEFGKDSLNALSIILSHELAHYYNDHTFCYDFSFAHKGSNIAKSLLKISSDSKKEKEIQADYQGIWYSLMAGYEPIEIFDKTFDEIYRAYKLPEIIPGYPTKTERKQMKNTVLLKIEKLSPIFKSGIILSENNFFIEAKDCFEYILQTLPTQENFNNAGLAYLSLGIRNKPIETIPFAYPLYNDAKSLLINNIYKNGTKGSIEHNELITQEYLEKAKKYFEKAISLKPTSLQAIINLASLHSINDNQEAAIGLINSLSKDLQLNEKVLLIRAIANYKLQNEDLAESFFNKIITSQNRLITFNLELYEKSKGPRVLLSKFLIKQKSQDIERIGNEIYFELNTKDYSCQKISDIQICNNKSQDQILIQIEKSQKISCRFVQNKWDVFIRANQ